ncbi:MAG: YfcE family phosphodiesterase [Promethearchaeota archaeon]
MVKILVLGDSHIPRRAKSIPEEIIDKINKLTENSLFDIVLFTGDVIKAPDLIEFLKSKAKRGFYKVLGNMDYYGGDTDAPLYQKLHFKTLEDKELVIGLSHGAEIEPRGDLLKLEALALEKQYSILIFGHTHKEEIFLSENGILLINPGSITGAWSFLASQTPLFIMINLMENNQKITIKLFQLFKNIREIRETNFQFRFQKGRISSYY